MREYLYLAQFFCSDFGLDTKRMFMNEWLSQFTFDSTQDESIAGVDTRKNQLAFIIRLFAHLFSLEQKYF